MSFLDSFFLILLFYTEPGTAPTDLTVMAIEDKPTFVQLNWHPPVEPNGELNGKHSISKFFPELLKKALRL